MPVIANLFFISLGKTIEAILDIRILTSSVLMKVIFLNSGESKFKFDFDDIITAIFLKFENSFRKISPLNNFPFIAANIKLFLISFECNEIPFTGKLFLCLTSFLSLHFFKSVFKSNSFISLHNC